MKFWASLFRTLPLFVAFNSTLILSTAMAQGNVATDAPAHAGMYTSVYSPVSFLEGFAGSEIMLTNNGMEVMEVTPIFYTSDGAHIYGQKIKLTGNQIWRGNLEDLLPSKTKKEQWGSIALKYNGKPMQLIAHLTLVGRTPDWSVDLPFYDGMDYKSRAQEAVWWMPNDGIATIAVGNTTDFEVVATVSGDKWSKQIKLQPDATRVLKFRSAELLSGSAQAASLRIETSNEPGSVVVAGFVSARKGRYSSVIRFYDPYAADQQHLFATGLRLKGTIPHMVLKNVSNSVVKTAPKFLPISDQVSEPVLLPSLSLEPQQSVEVDLASLIAQAKGRPELDTVSVQVEAEAMKGALIGALTAIDQASEVTYDVPLRDSGAISNSNGTYHWRIDGDYTSVVSITNVGPVKAKFLADVSFTGGVYSFGERELKPGESATFDIRKVRDEQKADFGGAVLPRTATEGKFHWSILGAYTGTPARLLGRTELVSVAERLSSSYSCATCCGDRGPFLSFDPNSSVMTIGQNLNLSATWITRDCFGWPHPAWGTSVAWEAHPSVVSISGDITGADITAVGAGSCPILAHYEYTDPRMDCSYDCGCQYQVWPETAFGSVAVKPTITGPNTVWWFNGLTQANYATQIVLTSSGGAATSWSVTAGANKVSISPTTGGQTTISSSGNAFSASVGDIQITASANGQTSAPFLLTTRTPHRLVPGGRTHQCDATFAYLDFIQYTVQDQLLTPLPASVGVNEDWITPVVDDFSGTNWRRGAPSGVTTATNNPAVFQDRIGGESLSNAVPVPVCQGPGQLVQHWGQEWRFGSVMPGNGRRVQINVLQKLSDHAEHTSVITPAP